MKKLLLILAIFFPTNILAIEFDGKFIQGHFILGKTDPNSKIIIDKKNVKVSDDGYFVFGIDRDRKFDVLITKITNGKSCLLYTSPSPRDAQLSRMPSSA